jgi:hypothetical protein
MSFGCWCTERTFCALVISTFAYGGDAKSSGCRTALVIGAFAVLKVLDGHFAMELFFLAP